MCVICSGISVITPDGLYEWMRMPFGIAGAPAVQQRMMDSLLAGMKWISALAYLDDVVIYSKTFQEHLSHLEALFKRCDNGTLQLNPAKSTLCKQETAYLCFSVSAEGVRPNPAKVEPMQKYPVPKDVKAVRQFLGVGSYCRRFIQNYARRAEPLQRLIAQDVKFVWGDEQRKAFENIRQAITQQH